LQDDDINSIEVNLQQSIMGDMMQRELSEREHSAPYVYNAYNFRTLAESKGSAEILRVTLMEVCPAIGFTVYDLVDPKYNTPGTFGAMDTFIKRAATCFYHFSELYGDIVLLDRKLGNLVGLVALRF
jgi:hypothetical protein